MWVGLLYDDQSLDAAWDLVKDWTIEERETLRRSVPKLAMEAPTPDGRTMKELAADVVAFSLRGLNRRGYLNGVGDNEGGFLDPLHDVVATGMTPADRLLARYHGEWNGDVSHIYEEFSF